MNHKWNMEHRIPACESPDGNERTERTCPFCMLVKITVHPPRGVAWREWRTKDGRQLIGTNVPHGCMGTANVRARPEEVPAI